MKVFVATYFTENYGSALQAYALQRKLTEFGAEPYLIIKDNKEIIKKRGIIEKILHFLKPEKHYGIIKKIRRRIQERVYKTKSRKIRTFICNNTHSLSLKDCFSLIDTSRDLLLAGSDQIWSTLNHEIDRLYLFDYSEFKGVTKASYAASVGISTFSDNVKRYYSEALRDFQFVSFREHNAFSQLGKALTNPVIRQDIDPTLLYSCDFWDKIAGDRICNKPYIFVYMLRPMPDVIRIARRVAEEKHLEIIFMGLYINHYFGIKTITDGGVEDFISAVKYAEYVVTNSFHGTAFSLLYNKKFVSVQIESTSSRAENILNIVNLQNHLIRDINEYRIIYDDYDCQGVNKILDEERNKSCDYLRELTMNK